MRMHRLQRASDVPVPEFSRLSSMLPYGPEPTPRRAELHRLALELRALMDLLVRTDAPTEALTQSADALAAVVTSMRAHGSRPGWTGFAESANAGDVVLDDDSRLGFFDHSPMIGLGNAIAPPVRLEIIDGAVHGDATFGAAYEGPPGCVHGGIVAAVFDELLGMAQSLSGRPGMTARLDVNYRRPTPLRTLIRYEGRLDRVEGRKIFTKGSSFHGVTGELLGEVEGLFISIDFARFAEAARVAAHGVTDGPIVTAADGDESTGSTSDISLPVSPAFPTSPSSGGA